MDNAIKRKPRYEVLEYIQSTGTQYIDTEFIAKNKYKSIVDFQYATTSEIKTVWGVRYASGLLELFRNGGTNLFVLGSPISSSDYNWHSLSASVADRHTFTYDWFNLKATLDSNTITFGDYFYSHNYSIYLFGCNVLGSIAEQPKLKLYSFKIYSDGTTLDRDYVPAKRILDGALGLYDKAHNKFYENAGTGNFIGGNTKKIIY